MNLRKLLAALLAVCLLASLGACANAPASPADSPSPAPTDAAEPTDAPAAPSDPNAPVIDGLTYESTVELAYADQFAIYKYEGGYEYIDLVNSDRILIVPEGGSVPAGQVVTFLWRGYAK